MKTKNTQKQFNLKGTSMVLAILAVLITILVLVFYKGQIYVGFIAKDSFDINITSENTNAYNLIKSNRKFKTDYLFFKDIAKDPSILSKYKIIWIHRIDTIQFGELEANSSIVGAFKNYLKQGGKLLLTMEALKYLNLMEVEKQPLKIQYANAADDGYGRKLGLHSFKGHPIFNKLHGGAYIFNPLEDKKCRQIGFFNDQKPENGKVIAVDWSYINLKERTKLAFEYNVGKGKVLAIGAYIYLSETNRNKKHLEILLRNTLNYLLDPTFGKEPTSYWEYKQQKVLPFTLDLKKPIVSSPSLWDSKDNTLSLNSSESSDNYCEVAGQRILLMGKEKGGIEEIWVHPFMAIRDFECGILLQSNDSITWLKSLKPYVEIRPEAIIRTYKIENLTLKEITVVDINKPVAIIHYEYQGIDNLKLFVRAKSNLRQMWPYSEQCTGNIYYTYNENYNSFIWKSDRFDSFAIVGSNKKPEKFEIGNYVDYSLFQNQLKPFVADSFLLSGYFIYNIRNQEAIDLVIAAGNEKDVFKDYQNALKNPSEIYFGTQNYYKELLKYKLTISTPSKGFNEGYKWALVGTDRFFVNTPNIGRSFVAGYSTTAHGWDGGHNVNGRPGYAWYFGRDAEWSSFAVLDYGDFEKVKSVLELFQNYQDPNGKIYHELTTSGFPHYDAADATPLYIVLAGRYLKHTGDVGFIADSWPYIKKAIDYCYSTDTDKDKLIENTNVGHGWVEGGWLYGAHTTLYLASSWASALYEASYIANSLGYLKEASSYKGDADAVVKIINENYWNPATHFYNYGKMKDGSFNPEVTIMASIPMLFGLTDTSKTNQIVPKFASNGFTTDWGTRIVEESHRLYNPRGYHTGSVWPLYTGWTSLAEYKYGYTLEGFTHLMNNLINYQHYGLGYVDEVLNGLEYKPGGVCNHQCWSETMVLQPIIEGMIGFQPDALDNSVTIYPKFPYDWDSVSVKNLWCGSKSISISMVRKKGKTTYQLESEGGKLKFFFRTNFPAGTRINNTSINGTKTIPSVDNGNRKTVIDLETQLMTKLTIEICHSDGISCIPNVTNPNPNEISKGFRIVDSWLEGEVFMISVEGRPSSSNIIKIFYPNGDISQIENGRYLKTIGDTKYIQVDFEESKEKYITKNIKIIL